MNETNIACPKCGAEIPLTEAVTHRLREQMEADFNRRRAESNAALAAREKKLAEERAALEKRAGAIEDELVKRLHDERTKLKADAERAAEEKLGGNLRELQAQLDSQRKKLRQAQDAELELRRKERALADDRAALELSVERRLGEERQKISDAARQQAIEAERLKLADKEKLICDLQREIQNLKQKAEQGSMQLQGETLELDLESQLRAAFRFDEITEVKKGLRGADLTQRVCTHGGADCGVILWEAKRAKNWCADWPDKLKADQRAAKAELAVIVTTCLPDGVRGFAALDGVWVCEPMFAVALASALRHGLISTAAQRAQQANRAEKTTALYDYLCSVEFRQHFEALVESYLGLKEQLECEQRAFARQWKEREQQLQKAIHHTAILYGGIQGITGREALPAIPQLQLPELPEHAS